jgi:chromosome partitioning protein
MGRKGKRVTLIDADPQGSALDWSQQRSRGGLPRLFGVVGLARDTLHREAPELARDADHVVIDGPPRVAGLMRSALLAADLVLIPVQPSPLDGWASAEMLALITEARIYRPELVARFVLNRCGARTVIARETAETLADHDPPVLAATIGQRVAFAAAAQSGRLVSELTTTRPPRARSRRWRTRSTPRHREGAHERASDRRGFARPADPEPGSRRRRPPRDADRASPPG